jgi:hypothetical protein
MNNDVDPELTRACRILAETLIGHPDGLPAREVEQIANEFEISVGLLRKAKDHLKVTSVKEPVESGRWLWRLPEGFELPKRSSAKSNRPTAPPEYVPSIAHQSECVNCGKLHPREQHDWREGTYRYGHCPACIKLFQGEQRQAARVKVEQLTREREHVASFCKTDPTLRVLDKDIERFTAIASRGAGL